MLDRFPEYINPLSLAEKHREYKGELSVLSMQRLSELLINSEGWVHFQLLFSKQGKVATITGEIEAEVYLECQNCLGTMVHVVRKTVQLGIINSTDEIKQLSDHFEPLVQSEDKIAFREIVEDEIILSIPDVPRHTEVCLEQALGKTENELEEGIQKESPFSILKDLKKTGV